ncbi:MAG: hypothetical protein ACKO66_06930 [Flavobacteriales bacterium]
MKEKHRNNQEQIDRMLEDLRRDDLDAVRSDAFWQVPLGYFETATEQWEASPWIVPDDYFEGQSSALPSKRATGVFRLRWTAIAAVGLVLIGLSSILFWRSNTLNQPSFAELLEQYPPEYDDLLEMDEAYITDVYMDVMTDTDTLVHDTLEIEVQQKTPPPSQLDPRTGLPIDKVQGMEVKWEDITDEEIMEYLKKNEKEELIIEE